MNTYKLKKFAQETRKKLLKRVEERLDYVLNADSAELREQKPQVEALKKEIKRTGRAEVIDKVAYTWFNRLVALRYMDVNDYHPFRVRVISPQEGFTEPQILSDAKQGMIPDGFTVDRTKINKLLDGTLESQNPQNEVFKMLLVAACNQLHAVFPFLFEPIADYSELLLPVDLISEHSVIHDVVEGMTEEDCQQVEILGWLYQFYISEKNNELISSKKKYKKDELAPASQLFTPKWIVQYMVDNTLGQLWSEVNPTTKILDDLEFYIEPAYKEQLPERENKSVEEITFFEPCVGSGHILSHAFDVFYKMYEEMGYNPTDIPTLILTKNLYGVDIDQRATQIASFVLMMKAREKYRRFFRKEVQPNIFYYEDFEGDEKFENATALGSLIQVAPEEHKNISVDSSSIFGEQQKKLKSLYKLLGRKYDVVVTNPPYISSKRMEPSLKEYVNEHYEDTKSDLFATFIIRCLELTIKRGLTGYMTPFVWMFISSYQKLREEIIDNHFINNLIQLEYSGFDGATVPVCTFTLRNESIDKGKGSYIRLSDFKGAKIQAPKTLEAIQNPGSDWFYSANQKDFEKIPGKPIGYWVSDQLFSVFYNAKKIKSLYNTRKGLVTGDNNRFVRYWFEASFGNTGFEIKNREESVSSECKWFPYNKGGNFRKWFGNTEHVVNWKNDGKKLRNTLHPNGKRTISSNYNLEYIFKPVISWSSVSSGNFSSRYSDYGTICDQAANFFQVEKNHRYVLAILNSKIVRVQLQALNPTLNFLAGNIANIGLINPNNDTLKNDIESDSESCIHISELDWDSRETSWDFQQNELIHFTDEGGIETLEEACEHYKQYWINKFFQLHQNEEELNRQFIEIYGLQEELTPEVPLEEITILQEELDRKKLKKKDAELRRQKSEGRNSNLPFKDKEVFAQFVSYAVGCMFGRYSLDQEGLILANQGETLEDFLEKIGKSKDEATFLPDEDNIIPVLEDNWFEDDITGLFYQFLRAGFGEKNFEKNLAFIEDKLGYDMRTYFSRYFYKDHYKRYNKRPIYWQFSSENGVFKALIYMHRYTPDTLNHMLNGYLRDFKSKLNYQKSHLQDVINAGQDAKEVNKAEKELRKVESMIEELETFERDVLMPLATDRINIDLDDGVLVNYNKFGQAVEEVKSLNDKKKKKKVKEFDWIDGSEIR